MDTNSKIKIFILPKQDPCCSGSCCCGPVGQSEEEIQDFKTAIEKEYNIPVEIFDTTEDGTLRGNSQILHLFRSLGHMALPIITIDNAVVSVGESSPEKAISKIKEKLNQA